MIINHSSQFKSTPILVLLPLAILCGCSSGNQSQNYKYQQQQPLYNQAQRQNYYAPQPPIYTNSPYNYQQPASRSYSNPYALPPQNQYPYYDGDQYYVPPTYYGSPNADNPINPSFSNKF